MTKPLEVSYTIDTARLTSQVSGLMISKRQIREAAKRAKKEARAAEKAAKSIASSGFAWSQALAKTTALLSSLDFGGGL